jgi:purine-binding chemotaxis protein CheW
MSELDVGSELDSRYLIYQIGDDTYASPLLSIREVLEYQKPQFMPNMARHFSGVINVRGAIVGVVDLRIKLGYPDELKKKIAFLLCDTESGPLAAVVDSVDAVIEISKNQIELNPPVQSKVNSKHLLGIAKKDQKMITILDIHQSLVDDQLKSA